MLLLPAWSIVYAITTGDWNGLERGDFVLLSMLFALVGGGFGSAIVTVAGWLRSS